MLAVRAGEALSSRDLEIAVSAPPAHANVYLGPFLDTLLPHSRCVCWKSSLHFAANSGTSPRTCTCCRIKILELAPEQAAQSHLEQAQMQALLGSRINKSGNHWLVLTGHHQLLRSVASCKLQGRVLCRGPELHANGERNKLNLILMKMA